MQAFVLYSLLAAGLWGIMSVIESVAGQYQLYSALLVKYLIYGVAGTLFVLLFKGWRKLYTDTRTFIRVRPWLFVVLVIGVSIGIFGTYFMYCAFDQCGDNKALAVIISYCVPVVVVSLLSYFVLGERYNAYAVLGVVLIVAGVLVIDLLGVEAEGGDTKALTVKPNEKR